ncbi:flagellar motor switch protein FliN [Sphingomonas changnyeongensis]|uniref:Flagellar motor switch protein FliN n=1 Tax=Sphingomonas changnyeongensis TaxID=2698679 RepID=A0A7Z2NVK8_9SPHN|nr:flagellar motor switch protein FliN [Sphingomonas changnyeongensis]QHL90175.1 flagellar motor switch protein FliN [Sphingomonas changnyeongensis]
MNDMNRAGLPVDGAVAANLRLLQDVDVRLSVEVGGARLKLRELLALGEASVVELDRHANELLDIRVNGTLIGRGEVVTVGDRFGIRIAELADPAAAGLAGGAAL